MKITGIERHVIYPPFHPFNGKALQLYHGDVFASRTIFVVKTDNGLEGLGEVVGPPDATLDAELDRLIGTNPCAWLGHPTLRIGVAPAIYDLVGKANDIPAYHLFHPKVRSHIPVAYWTVSQTPAKMAEEVRQAVALGYTWMKYHTDSLHNVVDQTRAMQQIAPPGFKIHYDVNFNNTVEHILTMTRELVQYPVAGLIEDPLQTFDFEGHKILRQKCPLPIIFHHLPLGGREAIMGLADGYMLGHDTIGHAITRAGLFEAANTPFMTQNVGGHITLAMVAHMAAAFEQATLHHVTVPFLWAEDVVEHPFAVTGGTVPVPEEPGLGVRLDRDRLERLKNRQPDPMPRALIRLQREGGPAIYSRPPRARRDDLALHTRHLPGLGEGYLHPVDFDYRFDDGSERFRTLWERTEREIVYAPE
jgi:L-alanine-DL-glutamate epimerase-like enolase superfamily enzyme